MKRKLLRLCLVACVMTTLIFCSSLKVQAGLYPFSATYSGSNEVPPNASPGTGTIVGVYNDVTNTIFYTITFSGLLTNTTAAHFHGPAGPGVNAGVQIAHTGFPTGVTSGNYSKSDVLTVAQETDLLAGLWYSNIHTTGLPGGEIRAQIVLGPASTSVYSFSRVYSGSQEVPPNSSPGTGTITGVYNSTTNTIFYTINFSGLTANTTAAHFHGPATPGVNAGVQIGHAGFPVGVTSGTYSKSDLLTNTQETQLLGGLWYSNIHTTALPGGEIRAQIFFDAPFVAPTLTCPNITVSNDSGQCSASVALNPTVTGDPAPTVTFRVGATVITSPHIFPVGTTTVNVTAINGGGFATCSFTVTVNDTEAPTISNLAASPNVLWPPNHKMKDVDVNYTTADNCPGPITCTLTVASDEPVNGTGDGDMAPDWEVLSDHRVKLRAERAGGGDGRVYTITVTCRDQYNNIRTRTTTVTVPHNAPITMRVTEDEFTGTSLIVRPLFNPGSDQFKLRIEPASYQDRVVINLYDASGRLVETRYSPPAVQTLFIGKILKAGIYYAEVIQGSQTAKLRLVKAE